MEQSTGSCSVKQWAKVVWKDWVKYLGTFEFDGVQKTLVLPDGDLIVSEGCDSARLIVTTKPCAQVHQKEAMV